MRPLPQSLSYSDAESSLRRQLRLVVLLDTAAEAGISPLHLPVLHTIAYLSNALAPLWSLEPFDGKVLKQRGAPFYPALQWDLDRLVARGIAAASSIRYAHVDGKWRLDARYELNYAIASPILESIAETGFEEGLETFYSELAQAISSLPEDQKLSALSEDAAYGDPNVDISNVVDFAEGTDTNFPTNAARAIRPDAPLTPAERIHLYVSHMQKRLSRHG